jgi:ribosomal 50S subunit-recycling heat shock protein
LTIRIDKWLWHARFYRTRPLAQAAAASGRLRLNGQRIEKASTSVKAGDVLTVVRGNEVLAVRICAIGVRRGPATEARLLYEILTDGALDPGPPEP